MSDRYEIREGILMRTRRRFAALPGAGREFPQIAKRDRSVRGHPRGRYDEGAPTRAAAHPPRSSKPGTTRHARPRSVAEPARSNEQGAASVDVSLARREAS